MENRNIDSTVIRDGLRVSTAIIYYGHNWFGEYFQYETIIFGDKFRMFIHGTSLCESKRLESKAKKFHRRMVLKLNKIINGVEGIK